MNVYRPLRGGSWHHRPGNARASYQIWLKPSDRFEGLGFRCALIVWRRQ